MTKLLEKRVEYHLGIVGTIWMPAVTVATTRKYERDWVFGTWTPQPDWDNPEAELEAIEDKLLTDTGDFQSVDDWKCEKLTIETYVEDDGTLITKTCCQVIRPWASSESETKYMDCTTF